MLILPDLRRTLNSVNRYLIIPLSHLYTPHYIAEITASTELILFPPTGIAAIIYMTQADQLNVRSGKYQVFGNAYYTDEVKAFIMETA